MITETDLNVYKIDRELKMEIRYKTSQDAPCPEEIVKLMDDYLFGRLSADEMERVESHYFNCNDCLHKLQMREAVIESIKTAEPAPEIKPSAQRFPLSGSSLSSWILSAAAAIALLVAAQFIIGGGNGRVVPDHSGGTTTFAGLSGPSFDTSPMLEGQLNQISRSNGSRLKVQSPDNEARFQTTPITFSWSGNLEDLSETTVNFIVMDNNESIVFSDMGIVGNQYQFTGKLPPGLYYWTLENAEESLYTGRFIILPAVVVRPSSPGN